MTGKYDFRSEPSKELELIDSDPVAEEHHFDTIYDKMLFEKSHDKPDYIDPAAAIRIIFKQIDDHFQKYHKECQSADQKFRMDMEKRFHPEDVMDENNEVMIRKRKEVLNRMWGK